MQNTRSRSFLALNVFCQPFFVALFTTFGMQKDGNIQFCWSCFIEQGEMQNAVFKGWCKESKFENNERKSS